MIHTATNTVAGLPIPVGMDPNWGRRHPGWDTGLRHEWRLQHCFGDQNGQPNGGGDDSGGEFPRPASPITPDGTRAYVANFTSSPTPIPSIVSVIATASNTVVATVTMDRPFAVAVSPNGQDVYVSKLDGTDKVRVIATATNTKVAAIPVGHSPMGVAIGP